MSGLHQCMPCGYRFEDEESLIEHEEVCEGDPEDEEDTSFSCNDCGELVDSEEEREHHERWCSGASGDADEK